jgi:exosortase A
VTATRSLHAAPPAPAVAVAAADPAWRRHLGGLAAVSALVLLTFHHDVADIFGLWWNSSTYGHCLFLLPIIAWLVWQRLPALRLLVPSAWAPGLLIVAAGSGGWLLGDAAGVAIARQYGLVMMLQGAVVASLGPAVARGMLFPLVYALFLVPVGEELVPALQTLTAGICMALLALADVPAHIDGVFITTPNGYFEVAEACSGVKFLIAMAAYAALVANVCFRSWRRRTLFVVAALALPIVANGLRAWGTIYVAYLTDTDFAAGFDHVVYGWVFFAVVMAVLMACAWPFFDRAIDDPWFDPRSLQPIPRPAPGVRRVALVVGAAAAIVLLPLGWSALVEARSRAVAGARLVLPQVPGWRLTGDSPRPLWRPRYVGASRMQIGRYVDGRGRSVDLAIAIYDRQSEGRELVGYGQGAIDPDSHWAWTGDTAAPPGGKAIRIIGPGPVVREVAIFYLLGDVTTGSDLRVKIETLKARLLGGSQRAAAVLVSAQEVGKGSARPAIDDFRRALGDLGRATGMRAR